ncbi:hypothetical protein [Mycobacterium bourgelatii]|uniref:hypothetical protein n=1 Tax=Mycobacterium bourgelatii TaxID=1273442 RepID=UPI0013D0BBAB|nr:hypothetical protein [Mycobacterium bourgelatii]
MQFDYGVNDYRTVNYPAASVATATPATLDNEWHDIDLQIDDNGRTSLSVDGNPAANSQGNPACGRSFIRVWAGAAEFSNFRLMPPR